ncbi:histamine H2 receptor-like [Glandiceps talaboti]
MHYSLHPTSVSNHSNLSLYSLEDDVQHRSLLQSIISGIVLALIILFTLTGNVLVVIAVAGFRRLQTVTNFLLLSLATADLTVAILVMPFALVYEVYGHWIFGWAFCHFWMSCDVMCCTASILNLCIISVDKYWTVTKPLTYKVNSKHRVIKMVAFVWICSATISFIPIFMGWYADHSHPNLSDPYFCGLQVNHVYAVISSTTSFYVPLTVMLFMYHRIYIIARTQAERIRVELKHIHRLNFTERQSMRRQVRSISREHKAVRTLGIIMGVFIVCWLPFFFMYLIMPFCPGCPLNLILQAVLTWLGYANSFLNPLIYAFFYRDFRKSFERILRMQTCKSRNMAKQLDDREGYVNGTQDLTESNPTVALTSIVRSCKDEGTVSEE